ncbi:hypothetical protein BH09VER1_BH09VER1_35470 [soil metagenome]
MALGLAACSDGKVSTSANAKPSEVRFLKLPLDAKNVRYWDHWHNRIAVFETTEGAFRAMFPEISFSEMTDGSGTSYYVNGFGDPSLSPWIGNSLSKSTSSGLIYQKIEGNGGGETILYDRTTKTGYYEFAAW